MDCAVAALAEGTGQAGVREALGARLEAGPQSGSDGPLWPDGTSRTAELIDALLVGHGPAAPVKEQPHA
jgi:hypothetical protein